MSKWIRGGALALVLALAAAAAWRVWRAETPAQPMSLAVLVDRGTEAIQSVDRLGKTLTRVPVREEIAVGRQLAVRFKACCESSAPHTPEEEARRARQQNYLAGVVAAVADQRHLRRPEIPYEARLLVSDCPNAFALPGGFVYMTTGLLERLESEAEVAAIIGHEIAHVDLGHAIEELQYALQVEKLAGQTLGEMVAAAARMWSVGFADDQEAAADDQGVLYAATAGYHPDGMAAALRRLAAATGAPPAKRDRLEIEIEGMVEGAIGDYFQTHPPPAERLENLERVLRRHRLDPDRRAYYVGRENHRLLVPRSAQEVAAELVRGRLSNSEQSPAP